MQSSIIVPVHCGAAGHRGSDTTLGSIQEVFKWTGLAEDCKAFVSACIHCITSRAGTKIPRPLALTLHCTHPNEVLHFDFLYCGQGIDDLKYLLLMRDDLSRYLWLWPSKSADAGTASIALSKWIDTFGAMKYWVSDQASHFKNTVAASLAKTFAISHQFVVAYSPWTNRTVERCMREVLRTISALLSEFKLGPTDWPLIINLVQVILNESPLQSLGRNKDGQYRSPLQVMTGLKPARLTLQFFPGEIDSTEPVKLDRVRARQLLSIETLHDVLDGVQKDVADRSSKNRTKKMEKHN